MESEKTILEYALEYHKRGWNVIPIAFDKKPPKGFKWTKYQTERVTEDQLQEWFAGGKYRNLGVIAGAVSGGLVIVDFDSMGLYEQWKARNGELADKLPTVKTSRGMHVYCESDWDKNSKASRINRLKYFGLACRCNGYARRKSCTMGQRQV